MPYPDLPLSDLRSDFCAALGRGSLLLEAEPGAGKSTLAPLWALDTLGGEIWLVQPRVLAAIGVARRLADLLGETPGQTVGCQVPFQRHVSKTTRLVVMTPGVLLQRLLNDPALSGVSCVMLDEIHERSIDQDVAWAWLQEAAVFNEALSLVLMSATPDDELRRQVDHSLYSPGRCFPVELAYCPPRQAARGRNEPPGRQLLRALEAETDWREQTVLVFLPGWRAIVDCEQTLTQASPDHPVCRLHSRVPAAEQVRALDARQGPRVILATNIAETSLTIADVTLVVDAGLVRVADFVQKTGVTHLQTQRISAASAEQRRGRAGRVRAGRCVRLWSSSETLAPQSLPDIRRCDYLPLALRLAHWGTPAADLPWLEAPNPQALANARQRLMHWDFLDANGAITPKGRQVARLGTHPRIAALLLHGRPSPGWWLMALALHFDNPLTTDLDDWLQAARQRLREDNRWRQQTRRWQRVMNVSVEPAAESTAQLAEHAADLVAIMADRLGHRTAGGRYRLNSGISVTLDSSAPWALVVTLQRRGKGHTGVGVGIELSATQQRKLAVPDTQLAYKTGRRGGWVRHTRFLLGGDCIDETHDPVSADEVPAAIVDWLTTQGLTACHWPDAALNLLLRARWAERLQLMTLPALDLADLRAHLDDWLGPFLTADSRPDALPLQQALTFHLGFAQVQQLDRSLPTHLHLPTGQRVAVDYQADANRDALLNATALPKPSISGKLQAFFGTERLGPATLPLQIKLLSPAGRPLAITGDLGWFWREVYPQVRKENRGRYAKHPWPEDPLTHLPTNKTKRALSKGVRS